MVATDNVGQISVLPVTAEVQTQMGVAPLFVSANYLCGISFVDEDANVQLEGLLPALGAHDLGQHLAEQGGVGLEGVVVVGRHVTRHPPTAACSASSR